MATRMKAARKPAPRLAGGRKARRRKAKKGPLRADTVHSDMPLWGRPGFLLRLASNPLRALFRGMRGIRYHTGSVRTVDDALA